MIKFKKACARMLTPKPNRAGKYNFTILSLAGLTTAACNSATDDQCYGGLGIIAGSFCARQNDVVKDDRVVLKTVSSTDVYELTAGLDADGNSLVDAVEFTKAADVTGTKYTLSSGDILKNPGKVSLSLINTGSMDGQSIFGAKEIEISTQGTTVILATEWVNNDLITVKNADQSVTLNNLQATRLDSAAAENNNFYPGTAYRVEDIKAPNETITYFFNEDAILGTSTELELSVKDSEVSLLAGVFVDPMAAEQQGDEVEDPFEVTPDTNLETLNLFIDDSLGLGSKITDIVFGGLKNLRLSGGIENNSFEISNPLDATLANVSASSIPVDLKINLSESILQKAISLGSGDDIITIGDALVALPAADEIDGGSGSDKLIIDFLGAVTVAPKLSSIEALELHFNGASTLDFSQTSDISSLEFLSGSADVTLRNVPFDISNLNISESQAGAWSIAYEENAGANVNVVWSNNTPAVVALASMNFDEVKSVSWTLDGSNDVSVDALSLDADDTNLVSLTNTNDGNLSISSGAQISTLDALTSISLTSTEGGDVTLGGVSGGFGISEAPKLSSITLTASQTGKIELGNIGSSTAAEDLQAISIITSGADVALGSIAAEKVGTFTASVASSAKVSIGPLDFTSAGDSLLFNGSGTFDPITFSNEAYKKIDFTDLITDTSVSFANATGSVTLTAGSGSDTITLGLGPDTVTGNDGGDIFVVGNGASGITANTADVITDFKTGQDKLKLGLLGDGTAGTGNYVEGSSSVLNFSEALSAANVALANLNGTSAATELYAFQNDSNSGYLFVDTDSDGSANQVLVLTGIENNSIAPSDIIA